MKAATAINFLRIDGKDISIHAAREGGDSLDTQTQPNYLISIHAAREGGDVYSADKAIYVRISIHAAREGGDVCICKAAAITLSFQSTPPVKAATVLHTNPKIGELFQSTPPVKAATSATQIGILTG